MAHVINTTRNKMSKPDEGFQRASADGFAFLWDVAVIGRLKTMKSFVFCIVVGLRCLSSNFVGQL